MTAPYTWQEIAETWLVEESKLALSPAEVVDAFNTVVAHFGRDWVERSRVQNGTAGRGLSVTLHITTLGQHLATIEGISSAAKLRERLHKGDPDARAELTAIHLVCSGSADVDLEAEQEVVVGTRTRNPDFRVRRPDDDWTYIEVKHPGVSDAQESVQSGLKQITELVELCEGTFALEVFLAREDVTAQEVETITTEIVSRYGHAGVEQTELADGLGTLYWNHTAPGNVTLDDHDVPYTPRLCMAMAGMRGDGSNHRSIAARWPFTDRRAQALLDAKAKQLSPDSPGLLMFQASTAVGAMKAWRRLIERRFQPNLNTRVSAVCLFSSALVATPEGDAWQPQVKLITNPYARFTLPDWIVDQLSQFPLKEIDL